MAGFDGCKFCNGRGCLACPGEKMKAEKKEAERRLNNQPLSEDAARFLRVISDHTGIKPEPSTPLRFENGIYRDCPKCYGVGCVSCPAEAEAEYKRQFPDGPQPIATFKIGDPDDVERAKSLFGREAVERIFGGGGATEIAHNITKSLQESPRTSAVG